MALFSREELAEKPLLQLLENAGIVVKDAEQVISARLADPLVAPHLKVEAGSALLWVKRLVRDTDSKPVEYLHALYRPDIYEYQMTMSRVEENDGKVWS